MMKKKKTLNSQRSTLNETNAFLCTCGHGLRIVAVCVMAMALLYIVPGCSTTKDSAGTTTTTLTPTGDAAVTAAIQIASAAAVAAINTYITTQPVAHARLRLAASDAPLVAAKRAAEREIENALPSLSASKVRGIVNHAFAEKLNSTP